MKEIQKVLETYLEARVAGDADLWLSLWDEGGVQLFPGSRAHDMDTLRHITAARFAAVPVTSAKIDTDDITLVGDHAFAHGHFIIERVVVREDW
ncbi:MAG: nuclear transport factor 2 family protein [Pseudomonadota bacterium]